MATRRSKTGRGKLPRGVVRARGGYMAWVMEGGKRVYTRTIPNLKDAARAADQMRAAKNADPGADRLPTLRAAFDLVMRGVTNAGTTEYYNTLWNVVSGRWDERMPIAALSRSDIEAARDAWLQDVAPATVRRRLALVRRMFTMAVREQWVSDNPASGKSIDWPKEGGRRLNYFGHAELVTLLESIEDKAPAYRDGDRFWRVCVILAGTGLRAGELARSQPEDWNLSDLTVGVRGKSGDRQIPFNVDVAEAVTPMVEAGQIGPNTGRSVGHMFQRWAQRLGEPRLHAHALRHTYGTMLAARGVHPSVIQQMMGHSTPQMTARYIHVAGPQTRAAAASLQLLRPGRAGRTRAPSPSEAEAD